MADTSENGLTSKDYWDKSWQSTGRPSRISTLKNPIEARLARLFQSTLPHGGRFVEIGCGGSAWMAYFAEEMGMTVWGVDYSDTGIDLAKRNLLARGIANAQLVLGDFTTVPLEGRAFRVVYSGGVVEHYQDPMPIFKRAYEILEPGGAIVTLIPNMKGCLGALTQRLDPAVYDVHIPYTGRDLDRFQKAAGFEPVVPGRPFGVFYLEALNMQKTYTRLPHLAARGLAYALQTLDRALGWLARPIDHLLDSDMTSPYFISIYRRPKE